MAININTTTAIHIYKPCSNSYMFAHFPQPSFTIATTINQNVMKLKNTHREKAKQISTS